MLPSTAGVLAALTAATLLAPAAADFNYTSCSASGSSSAVAKGDSTYLCLHLNGAVSTLFTPKVDEFDAISLTGSNYALPNGTGYVQEGYGWVDGLKDANLTCGAGNVDPVFYITLDVTFQGVSSGAARIYKKVKYHSCDRSNSSDVDTIPIYTVIIGLDNGVASYIAWDDGCFFCASNGADCLPNAIDTSTWGTYSDGSLVSCRQDSTTCYSSSVTTSTTTNDTSATADIFSSSCDLKVFVTWTGTDKTGAYLSSSGKRFSRYRQYGTASTYQSALNLAQDGINTAISTVGLVDGVPGRLIPGTTDERRRLASSGSSAAISVRGGAAASAASSDSGSSTAPAIIVGADGDVIDARNGVSRNRLQSLERVPLPPVPVAADTGKEATEEAHAKHAPALPQTA